MHILVWKCSVLSSQEIFLWLFLLSHSLPPGATTYSCHHGLVLTDLELYANEIYNMYSHNMLETHPCNRRNIICIFLYRFCFFLLLIIIPLCGQNIICFSVFLLMGIKAVLVELHFQKLLYGISFHRNEQTLYLAILLPGQLKLFIFLKKVGNFKWMMENSCLSLMKNLAMASNALE